MTKRTAKAEHEQASSQATTFVQLALLADENRPTPSPSDDRPEAPRSRARATVTASGKSVDVDGMRLYSDSGEAACLVLQRIAALLNADVEDAAAGGRGAEPLTLSVGGGRIDFPTLNVSIRVRGGARGQSRLLLADIVELWRSACSDSTTASGPAATADALNLHRFHFGVAGTQLRLEHPSLRLSLAVKGDAAVAAAAASRLAQAWNMLEGWPSVAAEGGTFREVDDAVHDVVEAFEAGRDCTALIARVAQALRARDSLVDLTGGRPHDCKHCVQNS